MSFTTSRGSKIPAAVMQRVLERIYNGEDWQLIATEDLRDFIPAHDDAVLHPMRSDRQAFRQVESPRVGADLIRKMMRVALSAGHLRRYFSLRRAWVRALSAVD